MNKKMKKALMAGAAMYGASKFAGRDQTSAGAIKAMTSNDAMNGMKKKSLFEKILNIGPGKNATSKKGGTLANKVLSGEVLGLGDMDGAKYGKMITAKNGVYVTAKCKNGRNKPTKIT